MKNTLLQITTAITLVVSSNTVYCQGINTKPGGGVEICYLANAPFISAATGSCANSGFNDNGTKQKGETQNTLVESDHCFPNGECFSAFIDNAGFPVTGLRPIAATLVGGPSAWDESRGARTVVNIAIGEHGDTAEQKNMQQESIELQLALTEPISPGSAICNVSLIHHSAAYKMIKGDASNVEVTDFIWSMDRKSFMLSINFNCMMHSEGLPDVNLKGKLLRVEVAEPRVVAAGN